MGTHEWPTTRPLIDILEFEPYRFEFDQAIRLVEMLIEPSVGLSEGADIHSEALKLRSDMDLAFPPSVVRDLRLHRNRYGVLKKGELKAALFGMAGVLGPLPLAFTDMLMDRRAQRDTAMRDFLDIFNHRLLGLMHRIRERSWIRMQWRHPLDQPMARYLLAIAGLGTDGLRDRLGRAGPGWNGMRAVLAAGALGLPATARGRSGGAGRANGAGAGGAGVGRAAGRVGGAVSGWGGGGEGDGSDRAGSSFGTGAYRGSGDGYSGGLGGEGDFSAGDYAGSPDMRGGGMPPGSGDFSRPDWADGNTNGYDSLLPDWFTTPEGVPDACILFYALHFGARPTSTSGLESMLSDFFAVTTRVSSFKGKWFDLDVKDRTSLGVLGKGTNNALGSTASLGTRAYDAGGGFDLVVEPKSQSMLEDFLPGGRAHKALAKLTRLYVGPGPEFGIEIRARLPGRPVLGLSIRSEMRLGWTARVCDSADLLYDPDAVTDTVIRIQTAQE